MQSSQRVPSGSRVCHEYHEKVSSRPNFPGLSPPAATLPASLRKIKASEKVAIPDTNTIVCTFLLDGVSL